MADEAEAEAGGGSKLVTILLIVNTVVTLVIGFKVMTLKIPAPVAAGGADETAEVEGPGPTLPMDPFVVNLNAQHQRGLQATEPMIDAALAALRANQGLGVNTVMRTEVTRVQQGVWDVGSAQFIGFQLTLLIKVSFGATYSG